MDEKWYRDKLISSTNQTEIERLQFIDDLAEEICKIRGIILPKVAVKMLIIVYIAYSMNTFGIKYLNEEKNKLRPNVGTLITCQKGSGKSRAIKILKQVFKQVETERQNIFDDAVKKRIRDEMGMAIPNSVAEQAEKEFKEKHGQKPLSIISDAATSKALCESYGLIKDTGLNNLLFNIDEAGDRIFKDGLGDYGTTSAKDFLNSINQLFDGYSGMGMSSAAKKEGIKSQDDVGANFIMVSTAEFLNNFKIKKKYQSLLESGLGRRFLILNCPHIDEKKSSRKRYLPNLNQFEKMATDVFRKKYIFSGRCVEGSEELWQLLEEPFEVSSIEIPIEFLLLLFCVPLAAWTATEKTIYESEKSDALPIKLCHWYYMYDLYQEIKNLDKSFAIKNTTVYDKICEFINNMTETYKSDKKCDPRINKDRVSLALLKDFCIREKYCTYATYTSWFKTLCKEFEAANVTKYLITKNQTHAWLEENFAYQGEE